LKNFLWIVLVSMVPMIELRAAIPLGCGMGLPAWQVYVAAVVGNMIPVPFIVLFIRRIFAFLRKHWQKLGGLVDRIEARAMKKSGRVRQFEILGLMLFVAIPLPGTGAWTGSLIAALLDIRLKRSIPVILLGVLIAGAIVTAVSYGFRFGISAIAN
jgi:uncharacterized membrane protein